MVPGQPQRSNMNAPKSRVVGQNRMVSVRLAVCRHRTSLPRAYSNLQSNYRHLRDESAAKHLPEQSRMCRTG
jgi:hypothetical protein